MVSLTPLRFTSSGVRNIAIVTKRRKKIPLDSKKLQSFFNNGFIFLILFSQADRTAGSRLRMGRIGKLDLVQPPTQHRSALSHTWGFLLQPLW